MLGAGLTFDTGNCPPGMYRPGVFQDCRYGSPPIIAPTPVYYTGLDEATRAIQGAGGAQSTQGATTQSLPAYTLSGSQAATMPIAQSGGGLDLTTLILIGAVLLLVMKK